MPFGGGVGTEEPEAPVRVRRPRRPRLLAVQQPAPASVISRGGGPQRGEVGKAYVVGSVLPEDVIAFAKERLANFKVPRHVELVDALPRNLSGKVLKTELRDGS